MPVSEGTAVKEGIVKFSRVVFVKAWAWAWACRRSRDRAAGMMRFILVDLIFDLGLGLEVRYEILLRGGELGFLFIFEVGC
jgi:hypothetical protein